MSATPDSLNEFTIRWRDGAYYVTAPELQEIRVVPKARLDKVERELQEALDRDTGGPHSGESLEIW